MRSFFVVALAALMLGGCDAADLPLSSGMYVQASKARSSAPRAGTVTGDAGRTFDPEAIAATCDGTVTANHGINFGKSGCLIVQPSGAAYALTDDVVLTATMKGGRITGYQLRAQDVIGSEGVKHESDVIVLDSPVVPIAGGFTVHVHAERVPVWRLSGHINGRRVEVIGHISLADVVYRPAP
jgi:hypothetical protein